MNSSAPIGVFDSGLGGLTVLKEIRTLLPHEHLIYVGDSGHIPYGTKSAEYIQQRSLAISQLLRSHAVKAIVVACNTATAAAATLLRATFDLPIVAMEPAVKPAVAATHSGVIGVLATAGTLGSAQFTNLVERFGSDVRVVVQACPGLVEQVEAGDLDGPLTRHLVERFTAPLLAEGADTIVLGCTHYPFLRGLIREVVGDRITLLDSGVAVARQTERVLATRSLLNYDSAPGMLTFWSSGDPPAAERMTDLWQRLSQHSMFANPGYFR